MKRGDLIWLPLFAAAGLILVYPETHLLLRDFASERRYAVGFIAFAIMGALGEALAARLACRRYPGPAYLTAAVCFRGGQGLAMALIFWLINGGVVMSQTVGILPGGGYNIGPSFFKSFLSSFFFTEPFFTSVFVNLGFVGLIAAARRLWLGAWDLYLNERRGPTLEEASLKADWPGFIKSETALMLMFRIPIMTAVFMLPQDLWLIMAAWAEFVASVLGAFKLGKLVKRKLALLSRLPDDDA